MITQRENMQLLYQHKEPEYMPFLSDFDSANLNAIDFVNERPIIPGVNKDWFGQSWTYEPVVGAANPTPGVHLVTDISRWKEQITFPDLDKLDWERHAERDTAKWQRNKKMSRIKIEFGMWERMFSVMDFQDALCSLIAEPYECYEFFAAVADHKIRLHDKVLDYYKPDVICMHDDYGTSQGMFMSPDVWRELLKPHLKRIVDHVQSRGCIYEHHNCGYFAPIAEDMLEIGIETTNPLHHSNNISYMKQAYGSRMVFIGGFDIQAISSTTATDAGIRESIRYSMDTLAPGGGYIPFYNFNENPIATDEILKYSAKFYGPRPEF